MCVVGEGGGVPGVTGWTCRGEAVDPSGCGCRAISSEYVINPYVTDM